MTDLWDAVARPRQIDLTTAMNKWRNSFGSANMIIKAAEGLNNEDEFVQPAQLILDGIRKGRTERTGFRVDNRRCVSGEVVDFSLISVADKLMDAQGYETLNGNAFGLGDARGIWYTLIDFPALAFPDGLEFITSGKFVVRNIFDPWKAPWEGKGGRQFMPLNGKRVMIEMWYQGPSSKVKL